MKLSVVIFLVTVTQFCAFITPKSDIHELTDNIGVQNGSDIIMVKPELLEVYFTQNEFVKFAIKFSLALLVILVIVTQFCTPKSDINKELLSDNTGVQNGSDVIMVNPGPLTIMLAENELVFEVCSSLCDSNFLVCYESDPVGQNVTEQCDSKCSGGGFYVTRWGDKISFMKALSSDTGKSKNGVCDLLKKVAGFFRDIHKLKIKNSIVKLYLQNATSDCPVYMKNATIILETTIPLPTTTHGPPIKINLDGSSGNDTLKDESGSFIGNYWVIFFIIVIVLIIIDVVLAVICCRRSKKEMKQTAAATLPPRKIQGSKSPIVVQSSTEDTHGQQPRLQIPTSLMQPSSILSRKSLLWSKKEIKSEETDLTSMA